MLFAKFTFFLSSLSAIFLVGSLIYLSLTLRITFSLSQPPPSVSLPNISLLVQQIRPVLSDLSHQNFFRYFRVDTSLECPFHVQDALCTARANCQLTCECPIDRLPRTWLQEDLRERESRSFSPIAFFDVLKPHANGRDPWSFDRPSPNATYVDLLVDKEQFTGYQGQNVWRMIYEENCPGLSRQCGENNLLSKLISGMHASVSSHLSQYFIDFARNPELAFPNALVYWQKVGRFPERLENLAFAVEVLLRAFVRYVDLIESFSVDTGEFAEDMKTKDLLAKLSAILVDIKDEEFHFLQVFGSQANAAKQREAYQQYFGNITRIMDCVDCVKCKVYGKMQVLGIGVALRILLKEEKIGLTRNELVAFVNTLNKWTESLAIVEGMKGKLLWTKLKFAGWISFISGAFIGILAIMKIFWQKTIEKRKIKEE